MVSRAARCSGPHERVFGSHYPLERAAQTGRLNGWQKHTRLSGLLERPVQAARVNLPLLNIEITVKRIKIMRLSNWLFVHVNELCRIITCHWCVLLQTTLLPVELFKAAVLLRFRMANEPHKSARDADVIVLKELASVCRHWKDAFSESGNLRRRRLKRPFHC